MIPIIIVALVALGVATATTTTLYWDDLIIKWKGKKLVVLGERRVGKTTLLKFLEEGAVPISARQTTAIEKISSGKFQLKDLDLKIKESKDIPGSKEWRDQWSPMLKEKPDLVLYLFRADLIKQNNKSHIDRVQGDIFCICEILKTKVPFVLVVTYCDIDPDYNALDETNRGSFIDKFSEQDLIKKLKLQLTSQGVNSRIVLGSLKDDEHAKELIYQIFLPIQG